MTANHQRLASLRTTAVAAAHTTIEASQIRIVGTAIVGRVMPGLGTARRIARQLAFAKYRRVTNSQIDFRHSNPPGVRPRLRW